MDEQYPRGVSSPTHVLRALVAELVESRFVALMLAITPGRGGSLVCVIYALRNEHTRGFATV